MKSTQNDSIFELFLKSNILSTNMQRKEISNRIVSGDYRFTWNKYCNLTAKYIYESRDDLIIALQKGINVDSRFFMMHLIALQKGADFPQLMHILIPLKQNFTSQIGYLKVIGADYDPRPYHNKGKWLVNLDCNGKWHMKVLFA
jgi:hypothetical protein